jgi:hypothetical protein
MLRWKDFDLHFPARQLDEEILIEIERHRSIRGELCPVYKKSDKLGCKNYRGICLLNVTYKVFDKILYPTLTHYQHYQAGFQSGKWTTDHIFALRQIFEKCNEFNITTHHLFIYCKAAYDTICMSELNFPTKLIRLTKATLTIVTCCIKTTVPNPLKSSKD